MSMKDVANKRTVCEVLREINDMHQGTGDKDIYTRALLLEAESMAKKMSHKLYRYSKKWDKGWWKKNREYEARLLRRLGQSYLTGESME